MCFTSFLVLFVRSWPATMFTKRGCALYLKHLYIISKAWTRGASYIRVRLIHAKLRYMVLTCATQTKHNKISLHTFLHDKLFSWFWCPSVIQTPCCFESIHGILNWLYDKISLTFEQCHRIYIICIVLFLGIMSQQRTISQSKEALLKSYQKRLKDDVRSVLDNYAEIIKLAKVCVSLSNWLWG